MGCCGSQTWGPVVRFGAPVGNDVTAGLEKTIPARAAVLKPFGLGFVFIFVSCMCVYFLFPSVRKVCGFPLIVDDEWFKMCGMHVWALCATHNMVCATKWRTLNVD